MESLESVAPLVAEAVYRFSVEERLRESERKFHAIFDQVFQFIALLKPDGTVLEVNEPALSFAKISLQEVVGRPLWEGRWWWAVPAAQEAVEGGRRGGRRGPLRALRDEAPGRGRLGHRRRLLRSSRSSTRTARRRS